MNSGKSWNDFNYGKCKRPAAPERDKESGEQVKQWEPPRYFLENGKLSLLTSGEKPKNYVLLISESDHLSALSTLQERVEKLEKELKVAQDRHVTFMVQGGPVVMAEDYNKLREELSTLRSSFAERAERAAEKCYYVAARAYRMILTTREVDAAVAEMKSDILTEMEKEQK